MSVAATHWLPASVGGNGRTGWPGLPRKRDAPQALHVGDPPAVPYQPSTPSPPFPPSPPPPPLHRSWVVALDSDWAEFGGHARNARDAVFPANDGWWCGRPASVQVYSPCRTVLVLKLRGTPTVAA